METPEEEDWVSGAALDAAVGERQIIAGDELIVMPLNSHNISWGVYEATVLEPRYDDTSSWEQVSQPAVALVEVLAFRGTGAHEKWLICRRNIVAWRRPKRKVG